MIATERALESERGSATVCIPVASADRQTLTTVRSVLEHSDSSTPILLAGVAGSLERIGGELDAAHESRLLGLAVGQGGQSAAVNEAARTSLHGDLALVVPGIVVGPEWLPRLMAAARSDTTVASATPLSIGVGAVELFAEGALAEGEASAESAARQVLAGTLALRPRIATMGPGCVYIRRTALELAGPLESNMALDRALDELARRAIARGMIHVAADDVLVVCLADAHDREVGLAFAESRENLDRASGADRVEVPNRVQETIASDERGPLRRSLNRGRTALRRLSVTIDGRALTTAVGGTQTYIIELILALAREDQVTVRVLVAPDVSARALDALATAPAVELLSYEEAIDNPPLSDVVHRPQQIFTPDDLALLRLVGERIVIGQQDLIAYHNHTYHPDIDAWRAYRRTTRLAMAGADQVIFFSEHARHDALAEDLLSGQRAHVVGIGIETFEPGVPMGDPPRSLNEDDRFLLCLGADYAHKNRPFAIELFGRLRALGWAGKLVFAGMRVPYGSSRERETEMLAGSPDLANSVLDLGPVDQADRQWLYTHARALLYPTLYEGFGLIPIEAGRAGLPCLFAAQASLAELVPDAATLIPWDADASATAVLPILGDGLARESHLAKLRSPSVPTWDGVARDLLAVYERALTQPPSEAAPRVWQELDREGYIVKLDEDVSRLKSVAQEYQDAYHALDERVSFGLPLIDKDGLLNLNQQRALKRIAARGRLGALVLAPLDLLGRGGAGRGGR